MFLYTRNAKTNSSKKNGKDKKQSAAQEEVTAAISQVLLPDYPQDRSIGLMGDVSEELASGVISALITLGNSACREEAEEANGKLKTNVVCDPIEMYISTNGGSAADMFAIYDTMRMVRKVCDISTVGLGKVMSAGVLILAAGSKGERRIGKNCRVMIHNVIGHHEGPIFTIENEMAEMKWTQERYINALCEETKMTRKVLDKLLGQKTNIYLSAEEAVKYGIADKVV
jgi:ATP-dependent Clp endopeptidase proteolytic subunit ClpP